MLKHNSNFALVGLAHIGFHFEPAVVHHALRPNGKDHSDIFFVKLFFK